MASHGELFINTVKAENVNLALNIFSATLSEDIATNDFSLNSLPAIIVLLCAIHPFNDGNGRTSNALGHLYYCHTTQIADPNALIGGEEIDSVFGGSWHQEIRNACHTGNIAQALSKWLDFYRSINDSKIVGRTPR